MIIEVCANSFNSAKNAQAAGADRIELCTELGLGGITPSFGLLNKVAEELNISVHVLVRPRAGDFVYSEEEFDIMKRNVELCNELGFDGVVTGVLNKDATIDIERTAILKKIAGSAQFVFHRAFDLTPDPYSALETLKQIEVDAILTSGQQSTAIEGLNLLTELHQQTLASDVTIMPGSGINIGNVEEFIKADFKAIHFSGIKSAPSLSKKPSINFLSKKLLNEELQWISDTETIQSIVEKISKR